jgi:hypothetical protein
MLKKFKKLIIGAIATLSIAIPLAAPALVHAEDVITGPLECGTAIEVTNTSGCEATTADAESTVNRNVKLGLEIFSAIVGIIAVVMIIVGGIRYITSGGDSGNVTAAKNTILYAVIGLVIVALAQVIVQFVLKRFTTSG